MKTTSAALVLLLLPCILLAINGESRYAQLPQDVLVTSTSGQVILQLSISLASGRFVFFESDGRFFPYQQAGLAIVEIRVDGVRVSNMSALDSRGTAPVQHSYNCIGHSYYAAGTHTVQLVAYNHPSAPGRFKVGSGSNLSAVVDPSTDNTVLARSSDTGYINVTTRNFQPGTTISHVNVLSGWHFASESPTIVLSSGRSYTTLPAYGDAMWGTFINDTCPTSAEHLWTVNDLAPDSETHAPMYGHAVYDAAGQISLQLAATELPYEQGNQENPVQYVLGSSTILLALSGNMPIVGSAAELPYSLPCQPGTYIPAGDGTYYYWSRTFTVLPSQQGNVMFLLKTRVLDCNDNEGSGAVHLRLELDGQEVGSTGVQEFAYNNTCHQRTLSASYLGLHLSAGQHTVRGKIVTYGLPNLAASGDLGLVFFGN